MKMIEEIIESKERKFVTRQKSRKYCPDCGTVMKDGAVCVVCEEDAKSTAQKVLDRSWLGNY